MINDFMSIAEKDGFPIWAAITASATLIIYLITTIAIRAFYLYFDKKESLKHLSKQAMNLSMFQSIF